MKTISLGVVTSLSVAIPASAASEVVLPASAVSDAERIRRLEDRVAAQDEMIRALAAQLDERRPRQEDTIKTTAAVAAPAATSVPALRMEDGITIKPRGRLQADALLVNSGDGATPTGTQLRRIQLGAEGRLGGGFRYSAEVAFAGAKVGLEDVFVAYQAGQKNEIQLGYFKPPITADDLTSDNFTLFLERSAYANAFAPGRRVGIGMHHFGRNWGLKAAISGERDDAVLDTNRQEAWVISGRGHANLLGQGRAVLHVALSSYILHSSSTDRSFSFIIKPETNRALEAISTGPVPARSASFLGGEIGFAHGPFLVQAEGGTLRLESPATNNPQFWGWSAQLSWRPTGEVRPYDPRSGVFGRVVPLRPVNGGGLGAVELGLRAGQVDLTDRLVAAGRLTTYGGVINWNPVTHVRFGANLVLAEVQKPGLSNVEQTMLTVRAAVDW